MKMKERKKTILYFIAAAVFLSSTACSTSNTENKTGPKVVKVERVDTRYILTVEGEPFYVKGAGCEFGNIASLAEHGANSFRTWRTDNGIHSGQEVLDEALANGLMVCMGIEIERERHGFDYDDPVAVKKQIE